MSLSMEFGALISASRVFFVDDYEFILSGRIGGFGIGNPMEKLLILTCILIK